MKAEAFEQIVRWTERVEQLIAEGHLPDASGLWPRLAYVGHNVINIWGQGLEKEHYRCVICQAEWKGRLAACPGCAGSSLNSGFAETTIFLLNEVRSARWECLFCHHQWNGEEGEVCQASECGRHWQNLKSTGILRVSSSMSPDGIELPKLIVEIDPGITDYARSLIPKSVGIQKQRWPAHITVIRNETLSEEDLVSLKALEGSSIEFWYNPSAQNDDAAYYWLNVECAALSKLRVNLGLSETSEWSRPPDGSHCFHTTIGNTK